MRQGLEMHDELANTLIQPRSGTLCTHIPKGHSFSSWRVWIRILSGLSWALRGALWVLKVSLSARSSPASLVVV